MPYYRAVAPAAAATPERIGVLAVNLGTPDAPSYRAVQRYLREFLGDRRVINTSRLIWWPILYGIILPLRPLRTAAKSRKTATPPGSRLMSYWKGLVARLEGCLQRDLGDDVRVALGMTYGNPSIAD